MPGLNPQVMILLLFQGAHRLWPNLTEEQFRQAVLAVADDAQDSDLSFRELHDGLVAELTRQYGEPTQTA